MINFRYNRQQRAEGLLSTNRDTLILSPHRIKAHHPNCIRYTQTDQIIRVTVPVGVSNIVSSNMNIQLDTESQISSPDLSESCIKEISVDSKDDKQKSILLKFPNMVDSEQSPCNSGFLNAPQIIRRRSSVAFNEYVILHTPPTIQEDQNEKKSINSVEKMTQTGDGSIWQV